LIQATTIDEYMLQQSLERREAAEKMRALIKECAPDAAEKISYRMPTYTIGKEVVVHFHTAKGHLGFYPTPDGIEAFRDKLAGYKTSKGAVQFPYENTPYDLIREIVRYRAAKAGI